MMNLLDGVRARALIKHTNSDNRRTEVEVEGVIVFCSNNNYIWLLLADGKIECCYLSSLTIDEQYVRRVFHEQSKTTEDTESRARILDIPKG